MNEIANKLGEKNMGNQVSLKKNNYVFKVSNVHADVKIRWVDKAQKSDFRQQKIA